LAWTPNSLVKPRWTDSVPSLFKVMDICPVFVGDGLGPDLRRTTPNRVGFNILA